MVFKLKNQCEFSVFKLFDVNELMGTDGLDSNFHDLKTDDFTPNVYKTSKRYFEF